MIYDSGTLLPRTCKINYVNMKMIIFTCDLFMSLCNIIMLTCNIMRMSAYDINVYMRL